ncbi:hypothetical protein [Sneathiella glossodoripedis]|uniref:hypothetical protein n=1 Tax=Sneathiella glossodoripedis TaxID=418853 RepID=UPI00047270D4|nr:hypothetical protein [Sneathiella glossodoripedis]
MSDIDPKVGEALRQCGIGQEGAWKHKQSGKWIVAHWALERLSAFKGITYDEPKFLVTERDAAAVVVTGRLGDKSEWSVGEAVVGLNYEVKGKQPGYPYAMAEKRAKDRVILKLIGLHGHAYSEEEADDFKQETPAKQEEPATKESNPFAEKQPSPAEQKYNEIIAALSKAQTPERLKQLKQAAERHKVAFPEEAQLDLEKHYAECLTKLTEQKEAA